ncbi:MAG: hypothetical protein ABS46_04040 [Cytophagaceae bacterium SCN 52-12]|nr:MAG: hypothetical protein ABS46_04040 [Cytophagaceae bacterium SCN 52-12]
MTGSQIEKLRAGLAESGQGDVRLMETHISWVLLGTALAWKIKKPVKLDFLDFTELQARHYYCRRELQLNQRLSPDIYLAVTPVFKEGDRFSFVAGEGEIVDYAVVMRKLDNTLLLSEKLKSGAVTEKFMENLASKLAAFHQGEAPVYNEWDETVALKTFREIGSGREWLAGKMEGYDPAWADGWIRQAESVNELFRWRFEQRISQGFMRDVHGDLHAGNIFCYENNPVIFDCLEFDDSFREIDLLYEIAFLCTDLDFYGYEHLKKAFLSAYQYRLPVILMKEDVLIFKYFCLVRAAIRFHVTSLKGISQELTPAEWESVAAYAKLAQKYSAQLLYLTEHYIHFEKEVFRFEDTFD